MNHQFGPAQTFYDKWGVAKVKKNENPTLLKQKKSILPSAGVWKFHSKALFPERPNSNTNIFATEMYMWWSIRIYTDISDLPKMEVELNWFVAL